MLEQHKGLKSNIFKFYLYKICSSMFFSVPVMVLYWQSNGLTLTQIMILQSLFSLLTLLLEIPSGYFADIHGRRTTLLISGTCSFIGMVIYSLGHSFLHFLVGELFFAIGISFVSGTASALVFDTLQNLGEEKQYKKVWGHACFIGLIALALSNILGGIIGKINLRYTLLASLPFFALSIPLLFSLVEPEREVRNLEKSYCNELVLTLKKLMRNKKLFWIIIYSGVVYAFNQSVLWLYQPYMNISGLDIVYFGFVFASFQVVAALSSKWSHRLEKRLGQRFSLIMLIILVGVSFLLMGHFVYLFSFSFCFIQQFVRGFKKVLMSDYINQLTTSDIRATILSVESFVGRLVYAGIIPLFGWVAEIYTIEQALILMGVTTLVSGLILFLLMGRKVFSLREAS